MDAAPMLSVAEGHLDDDNYDEALRTGREALAAFEKDVDMRGIADAACVIASALCGLQDRKVAHEFATEKLAFFKDKPGWEREQAKMLWCIAEVNYDKRGNENRVLARSSALEALETFKKNGDAKMEAKTLLTLCNICGKERAIDQDACAAQAAQAISYARQAGRLFNELGAKKQEALAAHNLAVAYRMSPTTSEKSKAFQAAGQALRLFREVGDKKLEAFEMQCISVWHHEAKDQAALPMLKEALEAARKIETLDGRTLEASAVCALVQISHKSDHRQAAMKIGKEAIKRFRDVEDKSCLAQVFQAMFRITEEDDPFEAISYAKQSIKIYQAVGDAYSMCHMQRSLAQLFARVGKSDIALEMAEKATHSADKLEDPSVVVSCALTTARIHLAREEFQSAMDYAEDATRLTIEANLQAAKVEAHLVTASVELGLGDKDRAIAMFLIAQQLVDTVDNASNWCTISIEIANLYVQQGDLDQAENVAKSVIARARQCDFTKKEMSALMVLATVNKKKLQLQLANDPGFLIVADPSYEYTLLIIQKAIELARCGKEIRLVAKGQTLLAKLLLMNNDAEGSLGASTEALRISKRWDLTFQEADALPVVAQAHFYLKEHPEALAAASRALQRFKHLYHGEKIELLRKITSYGAGGKIETKVAPEVSQVVEAIAIEDGSHAPGPKGAQLGQLKERPPIDVATVTQDVVLDRLKCILSEVLMLDLEDFEDDTPLMAGGVTSQGATIFKGAAEQVFPTVKLPATLAFDFPSMMAVADFIFDNIRN